MAANWKRGAMRAPGYDYGRACGYFVTVVLENRAQLFGRFSGGRLRASDAGAMVCREWEKLPQRFHGLQLDAYIAMPDHFHGILLFGKTAGDAHVPDLSQKSLPASLSRVIGAFKSITTNAYILGVSEGKYPPFTLRLWQRNFHDRIIGTDSDLAKTRIYVQNNPARWFNA